MTVFSHPGLVTLGKGGDEGMGLGRFGSGFDFILAGVGSGIRNVVSHCAWEEHRMLTDHGHLSTQGSQLVLLQRQAIEGDGSSFRIMKSQQESDDGGFARMGPTNATV